MVYPVILWLLTRLIMLFPLTNLMGSNSDGNPLWISVLVLPRFDGPKVMRSSTGG